MHIILNNNINNNKLQNNNTNNNTNPLYIYRHQILDILYYAPFSFFSIHLPPRLYKDYEAFINNQYLLLQNKYPQNPNIKIKVHSGRAESVQVCSNKLVSLSYLIHLLYTIMDTQRSFFNIISALSNNPILILILEYIILFINTTMMMFNDNNNNNNHSEKYAHLFILFLFKKDSFIGFKRDILNGINSAVSVLITIILIFTY